MPDIEPRDEHHLSAELATAYLDRELEAGERRELEEHLAVCDRCRRELLEAKRLMGAEPQGRWRRWRVVVPTAAAAVLVGLWLAGPTVLEDQGRQRNGAPDARAESVVVISPGEEAVAAEGIRFIWRSAGDEARYILTLTNTAGAVLWTAATQDTSAEPPADLGLARDAAYFWYVDALLANGETATSGIHRFRTTP